MLAEGLRAGLVAALGIGCQLKKVIRVMALRPLDWKQKLMMWVRYVNSIVVLG